MMPGTASCFWPNCGTQNEWMTSSARRWSTVERPNGMRSTVVVRFLARGYLKLHANCSRGHLDVDRVARGFAVLGEHDRARDRDHGHEDGRNRGPQDLEARVAVDGSAVGLVVGPDAELHDRVQQHRRDDGEDEDADAAGEPEDEVDPPALSRGLNRQPRDEERNRDGDRGRASPYAMSRMTAPRFTGPSLLKEPPPLPLQGAIKAAPNGYTGPNSSRRHGWDSEQDFFS